MPWLRLCDSLSMSDWRTCAASRFGRRHRTINTIRVSQFILNLLNFVDSKFNNLFCSDDRASSRSSTDSSVQVTETISSPEPGSPVPFAPPTNSPSSPRRRVIETESEDEGLDGAHYRRLWRTQCQHVRGWKRKHEVLTERFDKLRLCYAHMEKKKNDAIFMAFFLKAQNHFLQFKGKSPLIFYIQNFPNQKKLFFRLIRISSSLQTCPRACCKSPMGFL